MRNLDLLRWDQHLVRAGWRAEQTSNAYELVPTATVPVNVPRCGGHAGRETQRKESFYCPQFTAAEIVAAQAALAQRCTVVEGRLLRKGMRAPAGSRVAAAGADHGRGTRAILSNLVQTGVSLGA